MLDAGNSSTPARNREAFLLNSRPPVSSLGFLFMAPFVFAPSSLQIAGALSAIVILFITLWIGTLFEDLPKVLLLVTEKKMNF